MSALETMMPPVKRADGERRRDGLLRGRPRARACRIVLCHGFPELAFSWRHQIKALADAGRWVIAPDQRGYGLDRAPANVTDYDIGAPDRRPGRPAGSPGRREGDLLRPRLGRHRRLADAADAPRPRRRRRSASNTPVHAAARRPIRSRSCASACGDRTCTSSGSRTRAMAEAVRLAPTPRKAMRFFMQAAAGRSGRYRGRPRHRAQGGSTFAFGDMLQARTWQSSPREPLLTPEELAVFADDLPRRRASSAPVNWYRNFTRNWERRPRRCPTTGRRLPA